MRWWRPSPPHRARLGDEGARQVISQYPLRGVLGVWAAAALPMAALAWVVAPHLVDALDGPTALPRTARGTSLPST
jgi:hypothetical protein